MNNRNDGILSLERKREPGDPGWAHPLGVERMVVEGNVCLSRTDWVQGSYWCSHCCL